MWRRINGVSFESGSLATGFTAPTFHPQSLSPASYNDGFVSQDATTATTGETWNWGFVNESQNNDVDLTLHGQTSSDRFTQSYEEISNPGWQESMSGFGPWLAVDWEGIKLCHGLQLGAQFSASFLPFSSVGRSLNTFRYTQAYEVVQSSITDVYDVTGTTVPSAPYVGSFDGPGPIISFAPKSRTLGDETVLFSDSLVLSDEVSESLDLNLTTLSLGPTLSYRHGRLTGSTSLGLALNVAAWSADKVDSLYMSANGAPSRLVRQWHSHNSGTDVLMGGYVQAAALYELNQHWAGVFQARYDLSQRLRGQIGPSEFIVDPSGWSLMLGACYRF
jgi:hypothetical protein